VLAKGGGPTPTPSDSPTSRPAPSVTGPPLPTPTATASLPPTPSFPKSPAPPSASPTQLPTFAPTAQPSAAAALPPGIGLGATTLQLSETFSSKGSFPLTGDPNGTYAVNNGVLTITINKPNYSVWTPHALADAHPVLEVRGDIDPQVPGSAAGLMCGGGANSFLFGSVYANDTWEVGEWVSGTYERFDNGPLPVAAIPPAGAPFDLRVDCAVTGGPTDRIQVTVDGIKVADRSDMDRIGPYVSGLLVAQAGPEAPASGTFDNVAIRSGERFEESPEALRQHVPTAWAGNCSAIPELGSIGQVAALICAPAGTIDQAEYYQFDSNLLMQQDWNREVAALGNTVPGNDCSKGPSIGTYKDASGTVAGSVMCHPNHASMGGLIIIWTNEQLRISSDGVSMSGSYQDLANWWVNAGPFP